MGLALLVEVDGFLPEGLVKSRLGFRNRWFAVCRSASPDRGKVQRMRRVRENFPLRMNGPWPVHYFRALRSPLRLDEFVREAMAAGLLLRNQFQILPRQLTRKPQSLAHDGTPT